MLQQGSVSGIFENHFTGLLSRWRVGTYRDTQKP